jgi:hypothetical protein
VYRRIFLIMERFTNGKDDVVDIIDRSTEGSSTGAPKVLRPEGSSTDKDDVVDIID